MTELSIYGYIFNSKRFAFDLEATLKNFCSFADEVCVATATYDGEARRNEELKDDDTLMMLKDYQPAFPNLKIVETTISLKDNRFDGALKTAAMKACTKPIRCIADFDEAFVLKQRPMWDRLSEELVKSPFDGYFIPVIDLWGDKDSIRADREIGVKMRLHRNTVTSRGVPFAAERGDGYFNTSVSDSTECLIGDNLANFASVVPDYYRLPIASRLLASHPYVVHFGYLNHERRVKLNNEFWRQKWEERSGRRENLAASIQELKEIPTVKHGLAIE